MLNYTETASISTIVPITQPLQDQHQEHTPDSLMSMLSALLAHPEFMQGVSDCQDYYFDLYDEAPLTEEEMIWGVETNLSRRTAEADKQTAARFGDTPPRISKNLDG